jgi:hypothetical protein
MSERMSDERFTDIENNCLLSSDIDGLIVELFNALRAEREENERLREAALAAAEDLESLPWWSGWGPRIAANLRAALENPHERN